MPFKSPVALESVNDGDQVAGVTAAFAKELQIASSRKGIVCFIVVAFLVSNLSKPACVSGDFQSSQGTNVFPNREFAFCKQLISGVCL